MSLNMVCVSKRAINFRLSISIKANGITSHYSGQPRTVASSVTIVVMMIIITKIII